MVEIIKRLKRADKIQKLTHPKQNKKNRRDAGQRTPEMENANKQVVS